MTSRCPPRWGGDGELKKGGKRGKKKTWRFISRQTMMSLVDNSWLWKDRHPCWKRCCAGSCSGKSSLLISPFLPCHFALLLCVWCVESTAAGFFELDLPICLFFGLSAFLLLLSSLHLLCSVLLTSVDQSITPPPPPPLCSLVSTCLSAGTCSHVCAQSCKNITTWPRCPHRGWLVAGVGFRITHTHINDRCDLWTWGSYGLLQQQPCTGG